MTVYQTMISDFMAPRRTIAGYDADPRHVEAWIRLDHPTLDGMDIAEFHDQIRTAIDVCRFTTTAESEELARSFGL